MGGTKKHSPSLSAEKLAEENSRLREEIEELRETTDLQKSLYEISELHSTIYRIADLTGDTEDMPKFGELLHKAVRELIGIDDLLIARVDPRGPIEWLYPGSESFGELPSHRDGSFFAEIIHTETPFILGSEEIMKLTDQMTILQKKRKPATLASAPFFTQGKRTGTVVLTCSDCGKENESRILNMVVFISRQLGTIGERRIMKQILTQSRDELDNAVLARSA